MNYIGPNTDASRQAARAHPTFSSAPVDLGLARTVASSGAGVEEGPAAPARLTFLFAGVIAGVVLGVVALLPGVLRGRAPVAGSGPPAVEAPLQQALAAPGAPASPTPPVMTVPPVAPIVPVLVGGSEPPGRQVLPNETLVTFLAPGKGRRVLLDGHPITTTEPLNVACGRHVVRVSGYKARRTEFPCGAALTLE